MTAAPAELVRSARTILEQPGTLPRATWPRTAALLARQALEVAVAEHLAITAPGLEKCSRATQLICLHFYVEDSAVAHRAHQAWASLSHACHHHAYDLAPTATELQSWLHEVDDLVTRLSEAS